MDITGGDLPQAERTRTCSSNPDLQITYYSSLNPYVKLEKLVCLNGQEVLPHQTLQADLATCDPIEFTSFGG